MLRPEEWMDIRELNRQGLSQRQIARVTRRSRNTVAKVLSEAAPKPFSRRQRRSMLDPYKPYLKERYETFGLSSLRLLKEIEAQGFTGSLDIVQRYIKSLRDETAVQKRATVRFETPPGQQAQADWAHVGADAEGKIYAFVMVLSFSRMLYVEYTRSMKTQELIRCHQNAFAFFGGIPAQVLFDNQAQVRFPSGEWNPLFWDFAAHHGFTPRTHRPYRPRTKGKVERMVDYLKDNFLRGRRFADFADRAQQGRLWQEEANARLHATTGARPCDLLLKEAPALLPISAARPYVLAARAERRVDVEGYVHAARARYSVPPPYVGKRVVVVLGEQKVQVRLGETLIAEHRRAAPGACVADPSHVEAMWKETLARSCHSPDTPAKGARFDPPDQKDAVDVPPLSHYDAVVSIAQAPVQAQAVAS